MWLLCSSGSYNENFVLLVFGGKMGKSVQECVSAWGDRVTGVRGAVAYNPPKSFTVKTSKEILYEKELNQDLPISSKHSSP
jgi:hypothetical protein